MHQGFKLRFPGPCIEFRVLLLERGLIPRLEDTWEKFRDIAV
jgi:hypothetical protein